ncbi:MAG: hypothetical protein KKH01_01785 [Firmicutes bacterium]|nr:hypothetical protein [Bacillota bacterium]
MKKYNNIANHMNLMTAVTNVLFPILIVFFAMRERSIDTIIPMIMFIVLIIMINYVYFFLVDQWYFTYYDENKVMQKWFIKRKQINFDEVKYMYFVSSLVILSNKSFDIVTNRINLKARRKIIRKLKNEICIIINVYDKVFPKILLTKCVNATKIDFEVKEKIYREMFELD